MMLVFNAGRHASVQGNEFFCTFVTWRWEFGW